MYLHIVKQNSTFDNNLISILKIQWLEKGSFIAVVASDSAFACIVFFRENARLENMKTKCSIKACLLLYLRTGDLGDL